MKTIHSKKMRGYMDTARPLLPWIPFIFAVMLPFFVSDIYIHALRLQVSVTGFLRVVQILLLLWVVLEPFRRYFLGFFAELAANLLPIDLVLLPVFAQHHFRVALVTALICLLVPLPVWFGVRSLAGSARKSKRVKMRCKQLTVSASVVFMATVLSVSSAAGLCYAVAGTPPARPETTLTVRDAAGSDEQTDGLPSLAPFEPEAWSALEAEERMSALKELLDYEAEYLSLPPVSLISNKLSENTVGLYNSETHTIEIDFAHLTASDAMACVNTLCHEVRHAYQCHVLNTLDWKDERVLNGHYFLQARTWKEDFENPPQKGDFLAYYNRSIEVDARRYAAWRVEVYKAALSPDDA